MNYQQLVEHFKTPSEAARVLNMDRRAIWQWQRRGIPEARQYQIEVLTNGALKADRPETAAA